MAAEEGEIEQVEGRHTGIWKGREEWGGGGQWVFVKRLSGALRILAERGPLMGDRQA